MKLRALILVCLGLVWLGCTGARRPVTAPPEGALVASVVADGLFDCFAEGLEDEEGRDVSCEVSFVAYDGESLYLGNDKTVPGGSQVMRVGWGELPLPRRPEPVEVPEILAVRKLEAAALTPDGVWVLATTAFDRKHPESAEWHPYNSLLYWPSGHPERAQLAHPSVVDDRPSSIELRQPLQEALAESGAEPPGYFKIEGLAALPDGRLLFGVREVGDDYLNFDYKVLILAADFRFEGGELRLEDFRRIYEFDTASAGELGLVTPLGVSSLEYDRHHDRLLLLTSYEVGEEAEDLGAYLWVLPVDHLDTGEAPELVYDRSGRPFMTSRKAEGLAVIDGDTLVLVHDDDRVVGPERIGDPRREFQRGLHQTGWTVIEIR